MTVSAVLKYLASVAPTFSQSMPVNRLETPVPKRVPTADQSIPSTASLIFVTSELMPSDNFFPRFAQSNVERKLPSTCSAALNRFPSVSPSNAQSTSSTRPFRPAASFLPRFAQSIFVSNWLIVFSMVLTPVPNVLPIRSQSMPSTRPLNMPVMAFTACVIFAPSASQLIIVLAFSNAPLMAPAISRPMPS